jgi:ornithine carbamoyltransferase
VYSGLTGEWHPTQMLARFLTMGEASGKPHDRIACASCGDCRSNIGLVRMSAFRANLSSGTKVRTPADHRPCTGPRTVPVPTVQQARQPAASPQDQGHR